MDTITYAVTLLGGRVIDNLTLNGNNFCSDEIITADMFDGGLSEVHITANNNNMTNSPYPAVMHDCELVQITPADKTPDGKWWFILREIPADELLRMKLQAQLDYLAMSADVDLEDM